MEYKITPTQNAVSNYCSTKKLPIIFSKNAGLLAWLDNTVCSMHLFLLYILGTLPSSVPLKDIFTLNYFSLTVVLSITNKYFNIINKKIIYKKKRNHT